MNSCHLPPKSRIAALFEETILRSWWVVLFILLCYAVYEQAMKQHHTDYNRLHDHWVALAHEKDEALARHEDLCLQIHSQSDPAWVELILMKKLGLVPEGQTKVFFMKKETQ